jgi:hypothetical protein
MGGPHDPIERFSGMPQSRCGLGKALEVDQVLAELHLRHDRVGMLGTAHAGACGHQLAKQRIRLGEPVPAPPVNDLLRRTGSASPPRRFTIIPSILLSSVAVGRGASRTTKVNPPLRLIRISFQGN